MNCYDAYAHGFYFRSHYVIHKLSMYLIKTVLMQHVLWMGISCCCACCIVVFRTVYSNHVYYSLIIFNVTYSL